MFGLSYLVNPLIGLFPPVLALLQWRRGQDGTKGRVLAIFLGLFLIPVAVLALRNATVATEVSAQPGRLATNLVQGSWPLYHAAQNDAHLGKPIPIAIMHQINDETRLLDTDPAAGLTAIGKRMGEDPAPYAAWYLWDKPRLLWDWDIRVGVGGPYFQVSRNSPLERQPLLRAITNGYRAINPVLTLLAAAGALLILVGAIRRRSSIPATATALLALYLTVLHVVLQSEPRYANAYRGIEALLVATTCAWLLAKYQRTKAPL